MRAVEDDHVDRPGVQAQRCVERTGTNRPIGLIVLMITVRDLIRQPQGSRSRHTTTMKTLLAEHTHTIALGRSGGLSGVLKNPIPSRTRPLNAPAPMVLCLKARESRSPPGLPSALVSHSLSRHTARPPALRGRLGAGWSSPVARQAHNLKVAGSNPAPATNLSHRTRRHGPPGSTPGGLCRMWRAVSESRPAANPCEAGEPIPASVERRGADHQIPAYQGRPSSASMLPRPCPTRSTCATASMPVRYFSDL